MKGQERGELLHIGIGAMARRRHFFIQRAIRANSDRNWHQLTWFISEESAFFHKNASPIVTRKDMDMDMKRTPYGDKNLFRHTEG